MLHKFDSSICSSIPFGLRALLLVRPHNKVHWRPPPRLGLRPPGSVGADHTTSQQESQVRAQVVSSSFTLLAVPDSVPEVVPLKTLKSHTFLSLCSCARDRSWCLTICPSLVKRTDSILCASYGSEIVAPPHRFSLLTVCTAVLAS